MFYCGIIISTLQQHFNYQNNRLIFDIRVVNNWIQQVCLFSKTVLFEAQSIVAI